MKRTVQDLSKFKEPKGFRGRSGLIVLMWQIVQATAFSCSPQPFNGWRRFLLRSFGARIGKKVIVRQSARIAYPWKVSVGDFSWIGDHVELYSLGEITIGANAVVSQRSYLCAATHEYNVPNFPLVAGPICIGDQAWIATDVFIAPGVTIGDGAIVGARSSVFTDVAPYQVAVGSPARVKGPRT